MRVTRILITAMGSLGDLHPFVAVGLSLMRQGHTVAFCTFTDYQTRLVDLGFGFYPVRTGGLSIHDSKTVAYVTDARKGGERLLREFIFAHVHHQYADMLAATQAFKPDALLTSELAGYAARLVADITRLPWFSTALQPLALFSRQDPSVFPGLPPLPGWLNRLVLPWGSWQCNRWALPYHQLRQHLGLPPMGDPVLRHKFSPDGTLVMFDAAFAAPQPDWPANAHQTGFAFYDGEPDPAERDLITFCQAGPPPVIVTLGSAAVHAAQQFYTTAARAIQALGQRGLLLIGQNPTPADLPPTIRVVPYARHSVVFPFGKVIVHQGGIGTTSQALRAGVPSLVVPFSHDQPDNAHRCAKLGVGRQLSRHKVSIQSMVQALTPFMKGHISETTPYHEQARRLQPKLLTTGADLAADTLIQALNKTVGHTSF
jgi:rhamnosyltransferase subunit B